MSEENFPDEELEVVQDDDILLDETPGAASSLELDPVLGEPDSYPGAAENNPDRWQEDPLLQEEAVSGEEEDFLSEQSLRDETSGTTDVPTIGEAAADVDFGEVPTGEEADGSDDESNFGGSPLSEFDPEISNLTFTQVLAGADFRSGRHHLGPVSEPPMDRIASATRPPVASTRKATGAVPVSSMTVSRYTRPHDGHRV